MFESNFQVLQKFVDKHLYPENCENLSTNICIQKIETTIPYGFQHISRGDGNLASICHKILPKFINLLWSFFFRTINVTSGFDRNIVWDFPLQKMPISAKEQFYPDFSTAEGSQTKCILV